MLADILQAFGAKVYYYNRSRKPQAEKDGINYLPLKELLEITEIISLHIPKNTSILGEKEFKQFGNGKILINTSLGLTFDKLAFDNWIATQTNYAIFDGDGIGQFKEEFDQLENIISSEVVSGWTIEAQQRLSKKVLENVFEFIKN
jgi:lactate dehydrogenase-like 2-hydroxyacid dehydrogenase